MEENIKAKNILINARVNIPEYMIIKERMRKLKIKKFQTILDKLRFLEHFSDFKIFMIWQMNG
ncbi:MAG: hypothetical protein ACLUE7_10180 [Lachnospirales bacterium]